jgi:hypothetical protein
MSELQMTISQLRFFLNNLKILPTTEMKLMCSNIDTFRCFGLRSGKLFRADTACRSFPLTSAGWVISKESPPQLPPTSQNLRSLMDSEVNLKEKHKQLSSSEPFPWSNASR